MSPSIYIVVSTFGRAGKTTLAKFVLGRLPGARILEIESGGQEAEGKVLIRTDGNERSRTEVLAQYLSSALDPSRPTVWDVGDRDAMPVLRLLNTAASALFSAAPPVLIVPIVDDMDCATRLAVMDAELGPVKAVAKRLFVVKNLARGNGPALETAAKWAEEHGYTVCRTALPHADLLDNTHNTTMDTDLERIAATDLLKALVGKQDVDAMEAAKLGLWIMEAKVILPQIQALRAELTA